MASPFSAPRQLGPAAIKYLDALGEVPAIREVRKCVRNALSGRQGLVIDVGCGTGAFTAELAQHMPAGGQVLGIDASPAMIERARQGVASELRLHFQEGDARALPLPDATCDGAHIERVLQHLDEPALAIQEIFRVLKPKALLCAVDTDWRSLVVQHRDAMTTKQVLDCWAGAARQPAMGRELKNLLEVNGFVITSVEVVQCVGQLLHEVELFFSLTRAAELLVLNGANAETANRWVKEFRRAANEGRCFAAVDYYCVFGARP